MDVQITQITPLIKENLDLARFHVASLITVRLAVAAYFTTSRLTSIFTS